MSGVSGPHDRLRRIAREPNPASNKASVPGSGVVVALLGAVKPLGKPTKSRLKSVWNGIDPPVKSTSVPPLIGSTLHMLNGLPNRKPQVTVLAEMPNASNVSSVIVSPMPSVVMSFSK